MDLGAGEEPGGWPRPGLRVEEEVKGEREESRVACRRRDSFMASLSRSLDLMKGHRIRTYHIIVLFLFFVFFDALLLFSKTRWKVSSSTWIWFLDLT